MTPEWLLLGVVLWSAGGLLVELVAWARRKRAYNVYPRDRMRSERLEIQRWVRRGRGSRP
jgi:hypothetical protein